MIAKIVIQQPVVTAVSQVVKHAAKLVAKNKAFPKEVRDIAKVIEKMAEAGAIIG